MPSDPLKFQKSASEKLLADYYIRELRVRRRIITPIIHDTTFYTLLYPRNYSQRPSIVQTTTIIKCENWLTKFTFRVLMSTFSIPRSRFLEF